MIYNDIQKLNYAHNYINVRLMYEQCVWPPSNINPSHSCENTNCITLCSPRNTGLPNATLRKHAAPVTQSGEHLHTLSEKEEVCINGCM